MRLAKQLVLSWVANAVVLGILTAVLSGVTSDTAGDLIRAALLFGILNTVLKPVLRLLTLPLAFITLGLIWFGVSMLMLWLTDLIVGKCQASQAIQTTRLKGLQVLPCGYIPPNTLGRRLQDGQKRVRIYDRWYDVKCQVRTIHGLSAHADRGELLRFLAPAIGKQTTGYVVHGEVPQAESFAQSLLEKGIGNVVVPAMESTVAAYTGAPVAPTGTEPRRIDME